MADTLTISLSPEALARLRRLAEASGQSLESLVSAVLEDAAAEADGAMGDDAELARRVAAWQESRAGVPADQVHAWLEARAADIAAQRPNRAGCDPLGARCARRS